jgi:hypothetical protein
MPEVSNLRVMPSTLSSGAAAAAEVTGIVVHATSDSAGQQHPNVALPQQHSTSFD